MAAGSDKVLRFCAQIYIQTDWIYLLDIVQHFYALLRPVCQFEIVNKLENQSEYFNFIYFFL